MTELIPNLFIGNWHEARDARAFQHGFHIITVASDSEFIGDDHFKLIDGPGNLASVFHDAVKATCTAYCDGKKVLVHCIGGRSRSAAVIVAAATVITKRSLCDIYDELLRKHDGTGWGARIHPCLSTLLLEYA